MNLMFPNFQVLDYAGMMFLETDFLYVILH